jgi:hypothetical protein
MEFNWKIVSADDTTHSITVAYWTADHPEQIQVNIVAPPVGVDVAEYVAKFVPSFIKPVTDYQSIQIGVEGTATLAPVVVTEMPPATIPTPEVTVTPMPTIEIQKVVV